MNDTAVSLTSKNKVIAKKSLLKYIPSLISSLLSFNGTLAAAKELLNDAFNIRIRYVEGDESLTTVSDIQSMIIWRFVSALYLSLNKAEKPIVKLEHLTLDEIVKHLGATEETPLIFITSPYTSSDLTAGRELPANWRIIHIDDSRLTANVFVSKAPQPGTLQYSVLSEIIGTDDNAHWDLSLNFSIDPADLMCFWDGI